MDKKRNLFDLADAIVKILSGLLGIVFLAYMIYWTFFRK